MMSRRADNEAFVGDLVAEIAAAEAAGITNAAAIAAHLNAVGLTTRKGRGWTAATVAKFLASPGARRRRSGGGCGA
jgi:phosphoglycolate phosphatase-like HAD superfamily hydrolase